MIDRAGKKAAAWLCLVHAASAYAAGRFGDATPIYEKLKRQLPPQGDYLRRDFTRLGNKTIRVETFISTEMDREKGAAILGDFERYPAWALRGINERPGGGEYRLKLLSLKPAPEDKSVLEIAYRFDFPLFRFSGKTRFKFRAEHRENHFKVCTESVGDPDGLLRRAEGCARVFEPEGGAKGRAWIHAEAIAVVRSQVLYELLPEAVLSRILGERVEKIVANYLEREDELGARAPTKKSATR